MDWEPYVVDAPKGTPSVFAALEKRLGISLPDDLKLAFQDHPGDAPVQSGIRLGKVAATVFGPLLFVGGTPDHKDYTYSVEFGVEALKEWAQISDDAALKLMPFGTNTASGYFCLDYRSNQTQPHVVFIDMEYAPDEPVGVTTLATSFTEMLGRLYE
jgi:hypothetical protein